MKLQATASGVASTGANTATYTYPGTSHRLQNITGNVTKNFTYDATGNTLTETGGATNYAFTFDHKNRLQVVQIGATAADTVTYSINALGQRVRKVGAGAQATNALALGKTARFMYDEQGRLVGEYDNAGKLIQETVWMNDLPIATIRPKGATVSAPLGTTGTGAATANNVGTNTQANPVNADFFYVHPDHLGTPRVVSKPADNKKVWEWQSTPFGETNANENPQNLTGAALTAGQFRYNLRFPGQYLDAESGKHYNYFRDYDPSIGRYVESDPIGLRGGVNTFGYVYQTPLDHTDLKGLAPGWRQPMPIRGPNPGDFRYYGNWCGPGWTGGGWRGFEDIQPGDRVLPPVDEIDSCCQTHDKCHARCRQENGCNPNGRAKCFTDCDLELSKCASNAGGAPILESLFKYRKPPPGPDKSHCQCYPKY